LLRHTVFVGLTADKAATEVRREATNPRRTMSHHGMTPHISGTSLSAQARYAASRVAAASSNGNVPIGLPASQTMNCHGSN
jgi:hypothetical protein